MRVAIAEDGVLLREGLTHLLTAAGFEVTAQCADADALLRTVRDDPPDVAIVDIRLPPTHTDEGLRAALELRETHPDVGVLVLSQYVELGLALKLLADSAEGVGYLLKDRISRRRRVRRRGRARGQRRLGARPDDRLDPALAAAARRSAGAAHAARARGARADGHGQLQPGHRRRTGDHAAGGREVRLEHLRASSACPRARASRAACSPCCCTCAPDAFANAGRGERERRSARNPNRRFTCSPSRRAHARLRHSMRRPRTL